MPTLFMAYANKADNPLQSLREEDDKVNAVISERAARDDFRIVRESYSTRESLTRQLPLYQNDISLFLYSGHAGGDRLLLEDGDARAEGITALLGRCPNLKLVVLNGCSTAGQVTALLDAGVPAVIATSAPIGDETAKRFAIQFFTELSKNRKSIRESFQRALDAAKVYGKIEATVMARGIMNIPEQSQPLWGLYFNDAKADVLENWLLPAKAIESNTNVYINNAIEAIFDEHLKAANEDSKGQDMVLKRLPYTISEPIRKLLAPRDASGQIFYDQPSPERFKMLLYAYRSVINFVTFTLLSQLWAEKMKPENTIDLTKKEEGMSLRGTKQEGVNADLKLWLLTDFRDDDTRSLLPLLQTLVKLFKDNKINFFFFELDNAWSALQEAEPQEVIAFLEKQIADNPQADLEYLCDKTEENLAMVLYLFGFLVNYTLTSVKDIEVLFYMNDTEAKYDHKIVRLQQQITALEDRNEIAMQYYKTASVLLRHFTDTSHALYLSPFLIDENAYTKTPKANLRYFVSFDFATKHFYFKHVSKPEDILRIEKKRVNLMAKIRGEVADNNDYYALINGQFSAFCKAVLGKTIENL